MSLRETLASSELVRDVGSTLLHFLWQGAAVGICVAVALFLLRNRGAATRYAVCLGGLAVMAVLPVLTYAWLSSRLDLTATIAADSGVMLSLPKRFDALQPWLALFWAAGAALLQGRLALHGLRARQLRRVGVSPAARRLQECVERLRIRLGVHRRVRVMVSRLARAPMLIGWLKPIVLLPPCALTGLSPDQLEAVLAHELAHVRRHDYLVNLLQAVCESLLFYHPAVWWVSRRLRVEREYCCDDLAVEVRGDALGYARALSVLDELCSPEPLPAVASNGGHLMTRIQRILGLETERLRSGGLWTAMTMAVVFSAAVSAIAVGGETEEKKKTEDQALKLVDIVKVVAGHDKEQAQLLAELRERGLDNEGLLLVVQKLGPSEELIVDLEQAVERAQAVTKRLEYSRKETQEMLAAGKITLEQANKRMAGVNARISVYVNDKKADAQRKKEQAKKEKLIAELKAKGLNDQQIEEALVELGKRARKAEQEKADKLKQRVLEMREHGMTEKEIKQALAKIDKQRQAEVRAMKEGKEKDAVSKKERALIEKLHAEGFSKKEIQQRVMDFRDQVKKNTDVSEEQMKRLEQDRRRQLELRAKQMLESGMSKEEVRRWLAEMTGDK